MKKMAIGLSAFVLAVCGFVATKANAKFSHPTNGNFITASGGVRAAVSSLTAGFDTVSTGKGLVQMRTAAGTKLATLYTGVTPASHKIYR